MDRRETPSVPGCSSSSSTERASRAPTRKTDRRYRRNMSTCVRCHNHGIVDQIKDQDHFCAFRACKCDKCTRYSEYRRALPTENDAKETRARRKRHLAQEKKSSGPAPAHAQSQVQKASTGAGGTSKAPAGKAPAGKAPASKAPAGKAPAGKAPAGKAPAGKSPRGSADHSLPKVLASAPDARRFEDATKRASFREVPRAYGPALRDLMASDPDFDAAEWERKLVAAEALLTLKNSSRPRVATLTQPCIEPAKAQCPDVKPQRN